MRKRETKATLQNAIESLEANLAEERANHDITRSERDGFKEKSDSLETHLEAAYKDLRRAGRHIVIEATSSTGGVFAAALGGALTGAVMTIAFVWAVIHFGL